jgi:hypothetical protein
MTITRMCKCGCNTFFTPPAARPGQEYILGHKPRTGKALGKLAAPTKRETRTLDFKLALKTARAEMVELEREIDALDDRIVPLQQQLRQLDAENEALVARHLTLATTAAALEATVEGRDLRAELANAEGV